MAFAECWTAEPQILRASSCPSCLRASTTWRRPYRRAQSAAAVLVPARVPAETGGMPDSRSLDPRMAALSPEQQALLVRRLAARRAGDPALDEQGIVTGPVPLLPVQRQSLRM